MVFIGTRKKKKKTTYFWQNKKVFSAVVNVATERYDLRDTGHEFHRSGATITKGTVTITVNVVPQGTTSNFVSVDQKEHAAGLVISMSTTRQQSTVKSIDVFLYHQPLFSSSNNHHCFAAVQH